MMAMRRNAHVIIIFPRRVKRSRIFDFNIELPAPEIWLFLFVIPTSTRCAADTSTVALEEIEGFSLVSSV